MFHLKPHLVWLALLAACSKDEPAGDRGDGSPEPHSATSSDPAIAGFALTVDAELPLLLHATFTDPGAESWVEYRFEGEEWLVAPLIGPGEASVLGIPEETLVEARAAAVVDGETVYSAVVEATTGQLPPYVLQPLASQYDEGRASPDGYAMVSLASGGSTYQGPFVVEILDRQGRVVWFHKVPDDLMTFYPSVARDGLHLWFDAENIFGLSRGTPRIVERTLDGRWERTIEVPDAGQAFAEGPDDTYFYEIRTFEHGVGLIGATGGRQKVWDCDAHFATLGLSNGQCLLNATNWDEARDTVLASQFETDTVFEVDVATGGVVGQYGAITVGDPYTFDPPEAAFAYQHWPHWTPEGTLMVSTHVPCDGGGCGYHGVPGVQVAAEYEVDEVTKTLTRIWSHESTDLWATQVGEAYRLPNGNVIQGYGQDGAVRELTADGETVWQVLWPRDNSGFRAIGHLSLIGDLYALNRGH